MENSDQEFMGRSPNRLLANFSKGYMLLGIIVTLLFHVVFIGATSMQYVRDRWIDPEGAALRKAAAELEKKRLEEKGAAGATNTTAGAAGATNAPAASTNAAAKTEAAAPPADASGIPAEYTNSAAVKRLKEVAKPEEMPSLEKGAGVSLDDTGAR